MAIVLCGGALVHIANGVAEYRGLQIVDMGGRAAPHWATTSQVWTATGRRFLTAPTLERVVEQIDANYRF